VFYLVLFSLAEFKPLSVLKFGFKIMLKIATVATNNNNVKRVTFQSLGLDRAMHGNEAEMTIEQVKGRS
jgi:hypothetical protein